MTFAFVLRVTSPPLQLITLLECLSSLVLGVTIYGITHEGDHDLAMLGLVCRFAEGELGSPTTSATRIEWKERLVPHQAVNSNSPVPIL